MNRAHTVPTAHAAASLGAVNPAHTAAPTPHATVGLGAVNPAISTDPIDPVHTTKAHTL